MERTEFSQHVGSDNGSHGDGSASAANAGSSIVPTKRPNDSPTERSEPMKECQYLYFDGK
ncbi:hypothetical protein [Bacillus salipaludis]|uniref:hypothetical protein n=1 Tax=Bacillus salipaludis TaxID=2547811 RepID=UPI002E20015C|nr:hypothetical protein [Bacillus salipaludis]